MQRVAAIIDSMTTRERRDHTIAKRTPQEAGSRRGSGTTVQEVNAPPSSISRPQDDESAFRRAVRNGPESGNLLGGDKPRGAIETDPRWPTQTPFYRIVCRRFPECQEMAGTARFSKATYDPLKTPAAVHESRTASWLAEQGRNRR